MMYLLLIVLVEHHFLFIRCLYFYVVQEMRKIHAAAFALTLVEEKLIHFLKIMSRQEDGKSQLEGFLTMILGESM